MAIVVLFLWIATAVAGFTLLRGGGAAREAARPPVPAAEAPVRIGAAPLTANGLPPPIEFPRVATAPEGDHTLREFSHPALGVTGIGCWMAFTFVHYAPMAWIAFATLVVTLLLGLGWFASSQRSAATAGWNFPKRLVLVHGGLATCSLVLAVVTALLASRA